MSYTEIKERLRQETAQAAMKNNVIHFRPDLSPCPGDTFALRELSGVPAELLILERDPADVRRLKVIPVDDYPQIGSSDVELHLGEPGPLGGDRGGKHGRVANIRCDLDAWLDVSRFDVESRTGMVAPESLAEIRRKREALESGEVRASLDEEEVDGDPEYRRWKDETLRGVLSSLARPQAPARSSWSGRPLARHLRAVAAAAVLVVASWGVLRMDQLGDQVAAQAGEIAAQAEEVARLEQSRNELTDKLAASERGLRETSDVLSERAQQTVELERRIAALEPKALEPNLPFAFLNFGTGSERLVEHTLVVPEAAVRIALVFEVVSAEPYTHYGLRITDQRTGEQVWSHDEMQRGGSVVSLGLPASLLPSGDYVIVVSGYGKGSATPLDERYLLHVRRPGEW